MIRILIACALLVTLIRESDASEWRVAPYLELGAYHRLDTSDQALLNNPESGSDTMGTIEFGFETNHPYVGYFFGADVGKLGFFHQSYVDRGYPFNKDPEYYLDGFGIEFKWGGIK